MQERKQTSKAFFLTCFTKHSGMNIETSKIELVKLILNSDNSELIGELHKILSKQSKEQPEFTKDQVEEIRLGLEQLDRGERIEFSEYLKKNAG